MVDNSMTTLPIKEEQLVEYLDKANRALSRASWKPGERQTARRPGGSDEELFAWAQDFMKGEHGQGPQPISVVEVAKRVGDDPLLIPEEINHVLTVVRRAIQIGMALQALYVKSSGLDQLIRRNAEGRLVGPEGAEFNQKHQMASTILVFTIAYYVVWELTSYKTEETAKSTVTAAGIPELVLDSPVNALSCLLFYYGGSLDAERVRTPTDVVKRTLLYFEAVIEEIKLRAPSLPYATPFTGNAYRLEGSEFVVHGFEADISDTTISVEYNRVELGEIVGNRDAKHNARRLAQRLLCYDPETKRNPVADLGGLAPVRLGHGKPGTGKSMQIAATATMLGDWCKELGIPFLFWPFPETPVSTFQGGSAERAMDWFRPFKDPTRIIYGPIDDAENSLEDRTRQGVSAGVREVVGVFLRQTEGASAAHYGNSAIDIFTNIPDQIDPAVLSRVINRFGVDGAETPIDFLDQDHLWWRRLLEIDENFVNMRDPNDYEYLSAQRDLANLGQVYANIDEPSQERVRVIFRRVRERFDPEDHMFFAEFYAAIHEVFPFFTSRDVRNIQQLVSGRIMDFDFPQEWFDDPEMFFRKDYDTKHGMLVDAMRDNMRGLSFAEIRRQEAIRYCDNFVVIADMARRRRRDELVEQMQIQQEAMSILRREQS